MITTVGELQALLEDFPDYYPVVVDPGNGSIPAPLSRVHQSSTQGGVVVIS